MYLYKGEILAAVVLFGVIWAIVPWNPLSVSDAIWAALSVLCIAVGVVVLAEKAAEWIAGGLKDERMGD